MFTVTRSPLTEFKAALKKTSSTDVSPSHLQTHPSQGQKIIIRSHKQICCLISEKKSILILCFRRAVKPQIYNISQISCSAAKLKYLLLCKVKL